MNKITKIASILVLALFGTLSFGQTALTQTTLASAQGGGSTALASGLGASGQVYSTTVNLASATGITQAVNGQPVTFLLVGNELEAVLTLVTGQTTIFNVLRGQFGTKVGAHPSGDMVLASIVTPQFGGFQGSGGLQVTDPPYNGNCTAAGTNQTPWVNVLTGAQWLCSTITNTWVPGWNNPLAPGSAKVTAAQASVAGACTISGPLFHMTGALACTSFTIPTGFNATATGGGQFCVIPDGAFTTTATNNIAKASTAVVNQTLCFTWDATNSKFTASY